MTREEINQLAAHLSGSQVNASAQPSTQIQEPIEIIETHISWVLLGQHFAYKIKKPVKLPFLDFSSLTDRKIFCDRELRLNRRLAPQVYLSVKPVFFKGGTYFFGKQNDLEIKTEEIIDYAVEMQRLDTQLEMIHQLAAGRVGKKEIEKLANVLANFHRQAKVMDQGETADQLIPLFNDIRSEEPDIEKLLGQEWYERVETLIRKADDFLAQNDSLFQERIKKGFVRDCHGDLHCGNIFMYPEPIIFDCIEFSDAFRQIDLLHELAFLCMDLEARGFPRLATHFLNCWLQAFEPPKGFFDAGIFAFYKCYMANVRAKVSAMGRGKGNDVVLADQVKGYLVLMEKYVKEMG